MLAGKVQKTAMHECHLLLKFFTRKLLASRDRDDSGQVNSCRKFHLLRSDLLIVFLHNCLKIQSKMAGRGALKFSSALKELRIHLCQKSEQSKGVRDFVEKHYLDLKLSNPKFPILIRECSGVQPRVYARYDQGKEKSIPLTNLKAEDVLKQLETLVQK